ncbi:unnamed protein product [Brassica oleracea var. botrytis]|uniref:Uncharacterized protein n=2 Tax=Brassica TaxID=3705 RepID=A0A3P6FI28_BRAOL|nr:unnamed protein product [Brassica napus]VDD52090.1 unnamed protein product [Brassica oleracea]
MGSSFRMCSGKVVSFNLWYNVYSLFHLFLTFPLFFCNIFVTI